MTQSPSLIINSPYEEPRRYWKYNPQRQALELVEGRRPAGYVIATPGAKSFDDPGIFVELPLVNQIRSRVKAWREAGYPGTTLVTRRLLEYWHDPDQREGRRFFFAQLEAIETLIWLSEAPPTDKSGIEIPRDGELLRYCAKMATGTGKTVVMAMVIAWQVLNKVANPRDERFSKYVLVVAPSLTVRERLSVLLPSHPENYYDEFRIVPPDLMENLYQARLRIINWHVLAWETEEDWKKRRSVDKRGPESDEAYARRVLGELARARRIIVINDEAHHAWRVRASTNHRSRQPELKEIIEEATIWVGGLDRIHRTREIITCYDFSATPFVPSGSENTSETLFPWIVSDFGLNDAIESGLVKTPRIVIRDDVLPDAQTYRSRLYHLYPEVKDDLNRPAADTEALPDLVQQAYYLLGYDWLRTFQKWRERAYPLPPVMISVCNRTETAARVKQAFLSGQIGIPELAEERYILHIDSKVLREAELLEAPPEAISEMEESETTEASPSFSTKAAYAEYLRRQVSTVGRIGQPGEKIRHVISVGMLSEGWDAKTVTHIMGLRAFSSQLLCEQVIGRGLRRTNYEINPETGLLEPEYVNVFGVPFSFLPHETTEGTPPPPPMPTIRIEPDPTRKPYEIRWPRLVRVERVLYPTLHLDLQDIAPLYLDASQTPQIVEIAPVVDGKPDPEKVEQIRLTELMKGQRLQTAIFKVAAAVYKDLQPNWSGLPEVMIAQLIRQVEAFISSEKLVIYPKSFAVDGQRRTVLIFLHLSHIIQHVIRAIREENTERLEPVFDKAHPFGSTEEMRPWHTRRPCHPTKKAHTLFCPYDSTWEASVGFILDEHPAVEAWIKNEHLGFEIPYFYEGRVRKYRPDFLARLTDGTHLIIEVKGQETEEDRTKYQALHEWIEAVNNYKHAGQWKAVIVRKASELWDELPQGFPDKASEPQGCA